MPLDLECPSCGRKLRVPESAVGKTIRCPACKKAFKALASVLPVAELEQDVPVLKPAGPRRAKAVGFRCPFCGTTKPPKDVIRVKPHVGLFQFDIFETRRICSECRMQLGIVAD